MRTEEKLVFEAFVEAEPGFASRRIRDWGPGSDPPDILCVDEADARIGVELAEWLDEKQIKDSIEMDRLEASYLDAIRSQEILAPDTVGMVWLITEIGVKLDAKKATQFRTELLELIERSIAGIDWREEPQGLLVKDLTGYPFVDAHLQAIRLFPRNHIDPPFGFAWIRFPTKGGAYTPRTMVDALGRVLQKKTGGRYADLHMREKLDGLHLVVYYNKALIHNTPFMAPGVGFEEVAAEAAAIMQKDHGVFDGVFLFNAVKPDLEAIKIWPR